MCTICNSTTSTYNEEVDRQYNILVERVAEHFYCLNERYMFKTKKIDELFSIFLDNLPDGTKQHYNCNTCRYFFNKYGNIVIIDDDYNTVSAVWNIDTKDIPVFEPAIKALNDTIRRYKVESVFCVTASELGCCTKSEFNHFYLKNKNRITHEEAQEKEVDKVSLLNNTLVTYSKDEVETALDYLRHGDFNRSHLKEETLERFIEVYDHIWGIKDKYKRDANKINNCIWKQASLHNEGICRIHNTVLGVLLDGVKDGKSMNELKSAWNANTSLDRYQRPTKGVNEGIVERAEKIIKDLNLKDSLKRKFATLEEVRDHLIWEPTTHQTEGKDMDDNGVFSFLLKDKENKNKSFVSNEVIEVSYSKFINKILPDAISMEMEFMGGPSSVYPLMAIITEAIPNSTPILKYDNPESRFPLSEYTYIYGSNLKDWNINDSKVKITGIYVNPHTWRDRDNLLFILEGCKDLNSKASGLFPEILRKELFTVRSVIEQYSNSTPLQGLEEASACGLAMQDGKLIYSCTIWVTTKTGNTYKYKIR